MRRDAFLAWLSRSDRRSLWLSLGLSAAIGLGYALHLGTALHFFDEHRYVALADNIADHGRYSTDGTHPTAYYAPGWPLVLALVHLLGGDVVVYRLVNVALATLSVALGWWIAEQVGGRAVAAVAAPVLALYPIAIYVEGTLYPETLGSVLLLSGLGAAIQVRTTSRRGRWAVVAGASFGALILTVPNAWLPALAALAWLALGRARLWRATGCIAAVMVLVVSVWVVRDAVTMRALIPVTDANGYNLLLADSEHASIRSGVDTDISSYTAAAHRRGITSEVGLGNFYRSQATNWILHHPARAGELYVQRVADYFTPYDRLATAGQQSRTDDVIATISLLPLLALLLIRLARWRRDRPGSAERLLIWIYLLNALVAALFITRVRYRMPFDELLIVIAASTVISLARWGRPADTTGLAALARYRRRPTCRLSGRVDR